MGYPEKSNQKTRRSSGIWDWNHQLQKPLRKDGCEKREREEGNSIWGRAGNSSIALCELNFLFSCDASISVCSLGLYAVSNATKSEVQCKRSVLAVNLGDKESRVE